MELLLVLPWFATKLCRLWTALFREESELVAANWSALRGAISILDYPETPPGQATGAGCWADGQQWYLWPSVSFVGLLRGLWVQPRTPCLWVCPVLSGSLPEVDVGPVAGGGQGITPTVLGWAEEGQPTACRSLWIPFGSSRVPCGKVTLQGMQLFVINS